MIYLCIYLNIVYAFVCVVLAQKFVHIFQLRDYNTKRYLSYFNFWFCVFEAVLIAIFVAQILIFNLFLTFLINLILLPIIAIVFNRIIINQKTPIIYTPRLKRFYYLSAILLILPIFFKKTALFSPILMIFAPIFANFLNFFDKIKNKKFIRSAQNKIQNSPAKIIAITGSNGKTTVKNILLNMLKIQFNVVASPKSFNTPLGLAKFLNNTNLNVDYIILEYGARHKNDVKNLCKIYGADFGIITQIAPQHLQTFKTIENVAKAKQKLSEFLNFKPCVFNIDNNFVKQMFEQKNGDKISVSINGKKANFVAQNIAVKNFKTEFEICFKNQKILCHTKLLGGHNVTDILLAFALAFNLGVSTQNLQSAIENLQYIPHRLEHIKAGINILDDSYNCSLASAKESLSVLSVCSDKKMVVTPGIIEAGKNQFDINFELGKMLAKIENIVLVGLTNKQALTNGILTVEPTKKILFANSLDDAKQYFSILTNQDDTLLLLNDLPDDYK